MGIQGINPYLSSKGVDFLKYKHASYFRGKTMLIDGGNFLLKSAARIHAGLINKLKDPSSNYSQDEFFDGLMRDVLSDLLFFIENGINIVFIFEGEKDPDKEVCISNRKERRIAIKDKINNALDEYNIATDNPLEYGISDSYEKTLRKIRLQDFHFDRNRIPEIKEIFSRTGIPFFTAPRDAEFLCCSLVLEGKADTIYTSDTDCYAFGLKYIITDHNPRTGNFDISDIKEIISFFRKELNLDKRDAKRTFRDFCIMCGCDFNKRVYGIGPAKSLKLLSQYKKFSNIKGIDLQDLNYEVCVSKFTPFETSINIEDMQIDMGKLLSNGEELFYYYDSYEINSSFRIILSYNSKK